MKKYGLIGFPLTHSFSKQYFSEKFKKENKQDSEYELYELPDIEELPGLLRREKDLLGLNVTIPYKEQVIPYLDRLDPACQEIGAVNCIKITGKNLIGYNTDYYGFKESLLKWIGDKRPPALILGTGGASKAVAKALKDLGIEFLKVSRNQQGNNLCYTDLRTDPAILNNYPLVINSTPVGTFPQVDAMPDVPLAFFNANHWVYDLIYNPEETLLMKKLKEQGCRTKNGMEMLHLQAEAAWEIWQ